MKHRYNERDRAHAILLAERGLEFSHVLRNDMDYYFRRLSSDCSYFSIALAISLTWTKHAKYNEQFVDYAAQFIDGRIQKDENIIQNSQYRFGYETLEIALTSYRMFLRRVRGILPDFHTCSLDEITRLQHNLLSRLHTLRETREVLGIGCWLFLGPFKIILGHQERLWTTSNIDDLVLATGVEVERGLYRLRDNDYSFMRDFDNNWLDQGSRGLLESYGTCIILHDRMKIIAEIANTPAIHVNSALYLYGKKEI